ncbi:helix-turn-helix transcriptional regulator [Spongiactinospora sp. TRM90649]|uniref:helix-turn-helix domain-containing protein n=1 Tax=Spongiactinospora sp. TRM90649 TaxID=3031114 RepID=UPI0023F92B68|nr:helix-turn-helix transcriptional regulator [Spongiactinospora sp. TRM90649]MDF5757284.1 helix-turn-helix transcriptional regulator [Spongiactinospora sp. TRM90649]
MARGEHSPACARRWREQAGTRQWTPWQTAQAIHGCCGVSLLKAHRLARGWSARQAIQELEDLCAQHGLGEPRASIDLLNAWENNRARPRPQTIDLLARLYRANAVRLGLSGDYCEEPGDGGVVVVPSGEERHEPHTRWYGERDDTERRALFHHALLVAGPGMNGRMLAEVERTRQDLDRTLATTSVTEDQLDMLDEQVIRYRREYITNAPLPMLYRLMLELTDVRRLAEARQPAVAQRRLLNATTMLALLSADALMKLGDTRQAHAWYGSARTASDDMGDVRLRALVRAQQAMLPYYYGDPGETVRLAREARMLAGSAPSSPAALGAAAEARALARLGEHKAARTALAEAERIFSRMPREGGDHLAFHFSERRLRFYRTCTLIELGEAGQMDDWESGASGPYTIDPALIMLDQAIRLAREGQVHDACGLAEKALANVPPEHRTSIVVIRARALLAAVPPAQRGLSSVRHLNAMIDGAAPQLALECR